MGAFAFVDEIPQSQVDEFHLGDFVFTQRLNSFMSWAMMYITSSSVDHTGICMGDGKVAHRMLNGVGEHSIRAFAKGCRIIVVRMSEDQQRHWSYEFESIRKQIDSGPSFMHRLPPKLQLSLGGLMSIHGRYEDRFRWALWAEFFVTISLLCLLISQIFQIMLIFSIPLCSVVFLVYYKLSNASRRWQNKPPLIMSHPDIGYQLFFKVGGLMFTRMYPVVVSDLGLLPLKVVLGFARKGADDGADDKLEKAREFFGNLIEGWDIREFSEQAEHNDSNQKQDK